MSQARTNDPIVSPVEVADLADWIVGDADDPVLPALLKSSTGAVVQFLGLDLLTRDWTLTHWEWPQTGTDTYPSLSRPPVNFDQVINLPYANLDSVQSVEFFGESVTDFVAREYDIAITSHYAPRRQPPYSEAPAIVVEYRAGFGDVADDVPADIRDAIKMLAAFNFEHRGSCDAMQAIQRSGAAQLLQPWVRPSNVVVV